MLVWVYFIHVSIPYLSSYTEPGYTVSGYNIWIDIHILNIQNWDIYGIDVECLDTRYLDLSLRPVLYDPDPGSGQEVGSNLRQVVSGSSYLRPVDGAVVQTKMSPGRLVLCAVTMVMYWRSVSVCGIAVDGLCYLCVSYHSRYKPVIAFWHNIGLIIKRITQ